MRTPQPKLQQTQRIQMQRVAGCESLITTCDNMDLLLAVDDAISIDKATMLEQNTCDMMRHVGREYTWL
jgi:hypothetical protein